jgi:NAD(P)-dependent dehydrogenase (short-subunit alcohol dehydrogenase family)
MSTPIAGRVVLVTGASSGIGRATALALARSGARLALAARREELLTELSAEVVAAGGESLVVPTDVLDSDQLQRLVERTVQQWDGIDVVVGNAGIWHHAAMDETTPATWEAITRVDYLANVYLTLAALTFMRPGGQFIFINSLAGKRGVPLESAYAGAKHALAGFAGVARQELAARGISVTSIHPGRVDTAPFDRLRVPAIQKKAPPEKVAEAVVSAIRRPRPEVYVPAVRGRLYCWLGMVAPGLTDRLSRLLHLEGWTD